MFSGQQNAFSFGATSNSAPTLAATTSAFTFPSFGAASTSIAAPTNTSFNFQNQPSQFGSTLGGFGSSTTTGLGGTQQLATGFGSFGAAAANIQPAQPVLTLTLNTTTAPATTTANTSTTNFAGLGISLFVVDLQNVELFF